MRNFLEKNKFNIIRSILLAPIILVSIISISHVTEWYDIANPYKWALYLSISVEIAAMVSILGFSLRMKGGAWAIFSIVTIIQMIGNIFFSYKEIDANGDLFRSWVELTSPIWEMIGSDPSDKISMKRWLAFLEGGLLPIISLTSLHFFVKYDENNNGVETKKTIIVEDAIEKQSNQDVEPVLVKNTNTEDAGSNNEELNVDLVEENQETSEENETNIKRLTYTKQEV
jgi:hypothetical protein